MKESVLNTLDGEDSPPLRAGVRQATLVNFRNYLELRIDLSPGFNVVAGRNAQGKTNLLEALYLLGSTRLLRGVRDKEAITQGYSSARVTGSLLHQSSEIEVRLEVAANKSAYLNGMRLPRTADLLGRMPVVSIGSVDLCIVQGEPADRRLFLDLELAQASPLYLRHLSLYKKSLEHRNALLKRARERLVDTRDFEPWETQMAQSASELRSQRAEFLRNLGPLAQSVQAALGGGEALDLRYMPKDNALTADDFLHAFDRSRADDVFRGSTSWGPHRDDIMIEVDTREARLFSSQGQQRTAAVSIKLATLSLARTRGILPLLLLDDMLSDLDAGRRESLSHWVLDHAGQAMLTCTEPSAAGRELLDRSNVLQVENGSVVAL